MTITPIIFNTNSGYFLLLKSKEFHRNMAVTASKRVSGPASSIRTSNSLPCISLTTTTSCGSTQSLSNQCRESPSMVHSKEVAFEFIPTLLQISNVSEKLVKDLQKTRATGSSRGFFVGTQIHPVLCTSH